MGKEDFYGEIYGKGEENPTNKGGKIPAYAKSKVPEESNQQGVKKDPHSNAWDSTSKGQESADFKPKTEEDLAKERKSRKLELIAGAIGDGISSLSNLFFVSKGAPSMINTSGKKTVPSLMDNIRTKHKEQDSKYNDALTAWQKDKEKQEREFEKKKKEAEKIAKENERVEIHSDFKPKFKNWEQEDYINLVFNDLKQALEKHSLERALANKDDPDNKWETTFYADGRKETKLKSYKRPTLDFINSLDFSGNSGKYYKEQIVRDILSGEYTNEDLDEEFLTSIRKQMQENDDNWIKIK